MSGGGGKMTTRGSDTRAGSEIEARSDARTADAAEAAPRTDRMRAAASREAALLPDKGASPAHIPMRMRSAATGPLRTPWSMYIAGCFIASIRRLKRFAGLG